MTQAAISFIGAGNMASSMIGGLLEQGTPADAIRAADPVPQSLENLQQLGAIRTSTHNAGVVDGADVVVLAVKPQSMRDVLAELRTALGEPRPLVISIAAGINLASLENGLGPDTPIIRCMPNTPALLRRGVTGFYANQAVSAKQQMLAENILAAIGSAHAVSEEAQLDAVTALSGSGPAYFFLLMEAMADAGEKLGLDADLASELANQTALGAAMMATEGDTDVTTLRQRVSSPGGTTLAALDVFEQRGLREIVTAAMHAAADRADEMARELG